MFANLLAALEREASQTHTRPPPALVTARKFRPTSPTHKLGLIARPGGRRTQAHERAPQIGRSFMRLARAANKLASLQLERAKLKNEIAKRAEIASLASGHRRYRPRSQSPIRFVPSKRALFLPATMTASGLHNGPNGLHQRPLCANWLLEGPPAPKEA